MLFRSRQLGKEKGFEMWEELGFYEGFAKLWKSVADNDRCVSACVHAFLFPTTAFRLELDHPNWAMWRSPLTVVFFFVLIVYSRVLHTTEVLLDLIAQFPMKNPAQTESAEVDIPRLFNQIRSRYKMLCTFVGVKPSLRATRTRTRVSADTSAEDGGVDGVATSKKNSVWRVNDTESSGDVDFSF